MNRIAFELTVQYPLELAVDERLDRAIKEAVGEENFTDSGAGPLTGGRDLNFEFTNRKRVDEALARLGEADIGVTLKWQINRWKGEAEDLKVLAEGEVDA